MAEYRVTAPDGTIYNVTGPAGATDEQVLAQIKSYKPAGAAQPKGGTPALTPSAASPRETPAKPDDDSTLGFISGTLAKGVADLAGMPVDAITSALNLGIAGAGSITSSLPGRPPELIQNPPGGSQWFEDQMRRGGMITTAADPQSSGGRYFASMLQMLPGAMVGRPTIAQIPRALRQQATSGLAGQAAADIGGEEYRGAGSMIPGARGLTKPPSAGDRAIRAEQTERFRQGRELGIPIPPRELKPDRPQQKIQEAAARDLQLPEGTVLSPEILKNYRVAHYDSGYKPLETAPELAKGVVPTLRFQTEIQKIGNEINESRDALPETFKSMKGVLKLLGEYGYAQVPSAMQGKGIALPPRAQPIPAKTVIRAISKLRDDATTNLSSDKPQQKEIGLVERRIAMSLEQLIDENLSQSGNQQLLQGYRNARTAIAKAHDYEYALNPVTRKIDPLALSAMQTEGRPLSGEAAKIAAVAGAFPGAVRTPASQRDDYFTKRVTPMATLHPPAMAAHWLTRMWHPMTTSGQYQRFIVDPASYLSPEQQQLLRYLSAAQQSNQREGEIPAPPR